MLLKIYELITKLQSEIGNEAEGSNAVVDIRLEPQATATYTVSQLKEMGLVGVYMLHYL